MARQRDYAAEYARRMAGARTPEEREYARGHRGESAFARMVAGADSVRVYGKASDGKAYATIYKGGARHTFRLADGQPFGTGTIEKWKDAIANVPDAQVNISP